MSILVLWNYNSYQKEKSELFEKINNQLDLSIGDFNDSIFITFIDDIQADTSTNITTLIQSYGFRGDSLNNMNWNIESDFEEDAQEIEIKVNDHSSGLIIEMTQQDEFDSVIFERVQSFPHRFSKDSKSKITYEKTFSETDSFNQKIKTKHIAKEQFTLKQGYSDTLVSKEDENVIITNRYNEEIETRFKSQLEELGINLPFKSEKIESNVFNSRHQFIDKAFRSDTHSLTFYAYNWYVFQQILPNVILSILVLSLMLLSFFFMFYNWKKQSDLIKFKNDFMSNMTHELKTPISTVGVAIEAISDFGIDNNPSKRKEYLDIAKHEVNRLNLLVDKVLKMSAFDEQIETLNIEELDLNVLCSSVIKSLKLHLEKHRVQLNYIPSQTEAKIYADKIHLSNVIYNIIDNAIKYSEVKPELSISIYETSNFWNLQISDKGKGIAANHLTKVFDRFFRAPQDDRHDVKGYGLGLNYAKDIIEKHDGELNIESEINKGTTVTIKLKK